MEGPRQVPIRSVFTQCFTQTFHAPGVRETVSETELSGIGTHHWYAFWRAQWAQVRTDGSQPLTRGWREPGWPACYQKLWLPAAGFHCGFHGMAVFFTGRMPVCENKPHE